MHCVEYSRRLDTDRIENLWVHTKETPDTKNRISTNAMRTQTIQTKRTIKRTHAAKRRTIRQDQCQGRMCIGGSLLLLLHIVRKVWIPEKNRTYVQYEQLCSILLCDWSRKTYAIVRPAYIIRLTAVRQTIFGHRIIPLRPGLTVNIKNVDRQAHEHTHLCTSNVWMNIVDHQYNVVQCYVWVMLCCCCACVLLSGIHTRIEIFFKKTQTKTEKQKYLLWIVRQTDFCGSSVNRIFSLYPIT